MTPRQQTGNAPIVSVIVPLYNAQDTLEAAVDSVRAQTMVDWELLLVNDASTDGSAALCDKLALTDTRIRVCHQEKNQGAGPARNAAFLEASGEYIMMMDADDVIDADLLERAVEALRVHQVQTVVWGMTEEYLDAQEQLTHTLAASAPAAVCRTPQEVHRQLLALEQVTLFGYATNKLYRRDILQRENIVFSNEALYEDFFFNAAYAPYITSLVVLPTAPYHYIKRGKGLTAQFVPDYFVLSTQRVETMWRLCNAWGLTCEKSRRLLGNIYVRYIFSALQRNCDPRAGMSHAKRRAFLQGLYARPLFCDLIPYAEGEGRAARVLCRLLRGKHTAMALMAGRALYWVKNRLPRLFVKASR